MEVKCGKAESCAVVVALRAVQVQFSGVRLWWCLAELGAVVVSVMGSAVLVMFAWVV